MPLFKRKNPHASSFGADHVIKFSRQRAIMVYVPLILLTVFSTAVLWNHYDGIIGNSTYNFMAKVGLLFVDFVAFGIATWHLYAKHPWLAIYCFIAEFFITGMMILHAGAVLETDAGLIAQSKRIGAIGDAQAKIAVEVEKARIQAAAQEASRLNAIGQVSTARRIANSASVRGDGKAVVAIIEEANRSKPSSRIFSEAYMQSGIYFVPMLISAVILLIAVGIAKIADPVEDQITGSGEGQRITPPAFQGAQPSMVVAGFNPNAPLPGKPSNNITFNQTGGEPPKAPSQ